MQTFLNQQLLDGNKAKEQPPPEAVKSEQMQQLLKIKEKQHVLELEAQQQKFLARCNSQQLENHKFNIEIAHFLASYMNN